MTNNHCERALRGIALGRRAWMFFGSDDHAAAAAHLFSLIGSCELHGLEPETYLAEIILLVPYWPKERFLELAAKYWTATRAHIPAIELRREVGDITVPLRCPRRSRPYRADRTSTTNTVRYVARTVESGARAGRTA